MSQVETQGNLQSRSLLVELSISKWDARRLDKNETRDVASRNAADKRTVRVNKSLMPNCGELVDIKKFARQAEDYVWKNTLPWEHGRRIVSTEIYLKFEPEMSKMAREFERLVDEFDKVYLVRIEDAKIPLGGLFNYDDYPQDIRKKFAFKCEYHPVPDSSNWVLQMSNNHAESLRAAASRATEQRLAETMRTAWQRLHDVGSRLGERLADDGGPFHATAVTEAKHVVTILKDLNFTNDPDLERMRVSLDRIVKHMHPEDVRRDPVFRQKAATQVRGVMDSMAAFVGVGGP